MFNTELKPVKVYRSSDNGAPQLTSTAGSLKTVLKACLKAGYGNKEALGWDMPYEDDNRAVFKSKNPKACGGALRIGHTQPRAADADMMLNPTSLDAATGIYNDGGGRLGISRYHPTSRPIDWVLVGHDLAFCLIFKSSYHISSPSSRMFWFGDFPSVAVADTGNCLLYRGDSGNNIELSNTNSGPASGVSGGSNSLCILKSHDQFRFAVKAQAHSLGSINMERPYPDAIGQGLEAAETYLHEYMEASRSWPLRGIWPGVYYCPHDLRSVPELSVLDGFDGVNDKFIKFAFDESSSNDSCKKTILINATAWPA